MFNGKKATSYEHIIDDWERHFSQESAGKIITLMSHKKKDMGIK